MSRKILRAASAATGAHSFFSLASPPNGKLSSLFNRNSRSLFAYAKKGHDIPTMADSMARLQKFLQTNCKSGDVSEDEAFRLLDRMVQMEPRFPLYSFNLLLNGLAKKGRYCDVLSFYGKMNSADLTPNLLTLNILLDCFCDANRVRDAFLVLGRILRKGYSPTRVTFNSLINGLCIGNRVYDAVQLFSKLEKLGCRPNFITYNILCRGLDNESLCEEGNEDEAMELSDIDTPIGDINHRRPNLWQMLCSNLVANGLGNDIKDEDELNSDVHSKNLFVDWETLHDQFNQKLIEELLGPERSTQS